MKFMTGNYKKDKKTKRATVQLHLTVDETFALEMFAKEDGAEPNVYIHELLNSMLEDFSKLRLKDINASSDPIV